MATTHKTLHSQEDIIHTIKNVRLTLIQIEVIGRTETTHVPLKKPAAMELIDRMPGEFQMHVSTWDDGVKIATISKENG